jgi:hypothetical protein
VRLDTLSNKVKTTRITRHKLRLAWLRVQLLVQLKEVGKSVLMQDKPTSLAQVQMLALEVSNKVEVQVSPIPGFPHNKMPQVILRVVIHKIRQQSSKPQPRCMVVKMLEDTNLLRKAILLRP